ncbi:MAG: NAD(+)/NADH kinase [Phycisphaerae bacterium]
MIERVAIIASPAKNAAVEALERVRRFVERHARVVFAEFTYDARQALPLGPQLLLVLGGDGTLIAAAHSLAEAQIPIVGVNFGKLGYLAEFSVEQLETEGEFLFHGELPITPRVMLDVRLHHDGNDTLRTLAVNDCVVLAGPPYRMIEVFVRVDGGRVAQIRGDGLIISTASGSTAHNLSAGGPILEPTSDAFILTPICPHALTYRPVVISSQRRITIEAITANSGTTAVIDGHHTRPFTVGDTLSISRYRSDFLLVRNPKRSVWFALRRKLRWGEGPVNHV